MKDLRVKVSGDSSGIDQMVREVNQKVGHASTQIEKSFTGIPGNLIGGLLGGFTFGALKSFVSGMFETASQLKDTAEQFDLSSESIQKWEKALSKTGVSTNTFFRALETLRSKRAEARQDEKKRDDFQDVGLLQDALSYDVSDEDLLKKILTSGASRSRINDLLGRRGATLKEAAGLQGEMSPDWTEKDVKNLDDTAKGWEKIKATTKGIGSMAGTGFFLAGKKILESLGLIGGEISPRSSRREAELNAAQDKKKDEQAIKERNAREQAKKDEKIQQQLTEKREGHEERMANLSRGTMNKEEQRVALTQELLRTKRQIEDLDKATLTPDEQEKLWHLQERKQGIENSLFSLRDRPGNFTPTSLEQAGALFNNSMLFNPVLGVQQQQLSALQRIETVLREIKTNNPFSQ